MDKIKVSVIVPVYNVEKYLDKCLNNLVHQSLKEIEIIIVDDGSPDNSSKIINKYKNKYKNVLAFKKINGGLSDARNFGIKKAHGDYIAFVDSDDFISLDMYEKMYNKAICGDFDIVACDINLVYENNNMVKSISSNIECDTTDIKKIMLNIYPAAWNKIYKRTLFNSGIEFKKSVWFEDVEFIYRLLPYIKSIGVVKEPFYQYLQRDGSISKSSDKRIYNYIDNFNGIVDFYHKNNFYNKYYNEIEYCYVRYIYATFIKHASSFDKKEYSNAVNEAIRNVKEHFPKYRNNKYFYTSFKGLYLLIFNRILSRLVYIIYRKKR